MRSKGVFLYLRILMYVMFACYQLGAFIFTIMVDGHLDLFGLLTYIPSFKYISLLGMVFLTVDFLWYWKDRRKQDQENEELHKENSILKARLYEFQQETKVSKS